MLLPLVRSLKSGDDLDQVADRLPQEAYEALFFLSEGFHWRKFSGKWISPKNRNKLILTTTTKL